MHLDDDQWNDAGPETPYSSPAPWSGPTLDIEEEPSEELTQDLMSFLTDFRSALHSEAVAGEATGDENASGPATKASTGLTAGAARHKSAHDEPSWEDDPYLGSGVQVAADWWRAADGRWYPPELHPDRSAQPAAESDDATAGDTDGTPAAEIPAAASRPEQPGRKLRLPLVRPRFGKLGQSPATA